jgi:predicted Ser/Thr protein kinase
MPAKKSEFDVIKEALKGDYEVEKELGRGGMAIVFQAREEALDREVALKVLPFSLSHDDEFVERFQREARTAAKLEHPNIIPIYRVGKTGDVIYFAMKFLRGGSLADVIEKSGSLPPADIRILLAQCASALGYASQHGIVHRDIKPDNIMYNIRGAAVLTDFGIAKAASGTKLTGTGMAIGTPYYMSPEQARAQPVDGRSDLYSLGVVAYQCLVGSVPFDGEDSFSIGYKHIMEELPTPDLETAEQRALLDIIRRMMAKEPDQRFQTADELIAVLGGKVGFDTVTSSGTGVAGAATVVTPVPGTPAETGAGIAGPTTPTTPMPRSSLDVPKVKKKSSGMLVGVSAVVILGGLGGGGYYYTAVMGNSLPFIGNPFDTEIAIPDNEIPDPDPLAIAADSAASDSAEVEDTTAMETDSATVEDTTTVADTATVVVDDPTPPADGSLVIDLRPQTARITIDGRAASGLNHRLPPGTYTVAASAPGYIGVTRTVDITSGQPSRLNFALQEEAPPPPESQCTDFNPDSYNLNGECFDSRARPRDATLVPLTEDILTTPSNVVLAIKVLADGTVEQVLPVTPSDNAAFTVLALTFARDLDYVPAQKDGQSVTSWTQQVFHPKAR